MTIEEPVLAVIVPVYNTAASIPTLVERIHTTAQSCHVTYELILVDDHSSDASWDAIVAACNRWPNTRGIRLAYNHGHHPALVAGARNTNAPWVFVLDCDLEDKPEVLAQIWPPQDFDVAFVRRSTPRPRNSRGFAGRLFYRAFNLLAYHPIEAAIANQWLARRQDVLRLARCGGNGVQLTIALQTLPLRRRVITEPRGQRFEPGTTYTWRALVREGIGAMALYGEPAAQRLFLLGMVVGGTIALLHPLAGVVAGLPGLVAALGLYATRRTLLRRTIPTEIAAIYPN